MSRSTKPEKKIIEVKFTNSEILNLYEGLKTCDDVSGNNKFSYAIARSQSLLEPVKKAIEKTNEMGKEVKQYELERQNLVQEFSKKVDGKVVNTVKFNNYTLDPELIDEAKFNRKAKSLESSNQKHIDNREDQIKKYIKFLEEDAVEEPNLHKLNIEDIPDDITLLQLYNASFLFGIEIKDTITKKLRVLDILPISVILQTIGDAKDETFVDKMSFNLRMMKEVRDNVIFKAKEIKDYQHYLEDRDELRDSLCGINVMGKPAKTILPTGTITFHFDDSAKASKKIEDHRDNNQSVIDAYEEYIESELDIKIKQISWDDLPDDITSAKMKHLLPFIKN